MIINFLNKGLKALWNNGSKKGIQPSLAPRLEMILDAINAATDISQLNLPGFKLHELKGDRKGTYSIWVNGNFRITFKFVDGDAYDVDLEDYH